MCKFTNVQIKQMCKLANVKQPNDKVVKRKSCQLFQELATFFICTFAN
jgi:hypothetical protein